MTRRSIQSSTLFLVTTFIIVALYAFMAISAEAAPSATHTVNLQLDSSEPATTVGDGICDINPLVSGNQCTLRAAIDEANAVPGPDTIDFSLPSLGSQPIVTLTIDASLGQLPTLTDSSTTIKGATQPGAACPLSSDVPAQLKIVINGSDLGGTSNGLVVDPTATRTTISGLVIVNFGGDGVLLKSSGTSITCTHIGVGVDGISPQGNRNGILINESSANRIGGTSANMRNVISANGVNGIRVIGASSMGNVILGNRIGTTADGMTALGNLSMGVALVTGPENTMVGGARGSGCDQSCNLISGNGMFGIYGYRADSMTLQGNFIGTNLDGTLAIPNEQTGIFLYESPETTIGGLPGGTNNYRNIISGNIGNGIQLRSAPTAIVPTANTIIQDAYVGVALDGTSPLPNGQYGIAVENAYETTIDSSHIGFNGVHGVLVHESVDTNITNSLVEGNSGSGIYAQNSQSTIVGGAGKGNFIYSNDANGILFFGPATTDSAAYGNLIGLDGNMVPGMGNLENGILIDSASGVNIGSSTSASSAADMANTIGANGENGIVIRGSDANHNVIDSNYIGTNMTGTVGLGNSIHGVSVTSGASDNLIGLANSSGGGTGIGVSTSNVIAENSIDGINVAAGERNRLHRNLYYRNGQLGINLGSDIVTSNDAGDVDSGANNLQNFPTISNHISTNLLIGLDSAPSTAYTVTLYINDDCDPTNHGEGSIWREDMVLVTGVSGGGSLVTTYAPAVAGQFITAIAIDPDGNTSEFSACFEIPSPTAVGLGSVGSSAEILHPITLPLLLSLLTVSALVIGRRYRP